ncbi:hypothetical protein HPB49_016170 [Dermacentor silvarum]|uniref:Uncharacterized protein n=1 Tax=Dermacentor silvarum TaxID=543639 RepID=A0ACB8DQL8_DERSI|nr:hypothetical protein HPB49_016170 [Dermacentor silvarum]
MILAKATPQEEASPKSGTVTLLEGFISADTRALIQENVYVILGHGRFQRIVLVTAFVANLVVLLHSFAYYLIGRPVDHCAGHPTTCGTLVSRAGRTSRYQCRPMAASASAPCTNPLYR